MAYSEQVVYIFKDKSTDSINSLLKNDLPVIIKHFWIFIKSPTPDFTTASFHSPNSKSPSGHISFLSYYMHKPTKL